VVGKSKVNVANSILEFLGATEEIHVKTLLEHDPLKPKDVIQRAVAVLGKVGYNFLGENCQHCAYYISLGYASSDSVLLPLSLISILLILFAFLDIAYIYQIGGRFYGFVWLLSVFLIVLRGGWQVTYAFSCSLQFFFGIAFQILLILWCLFKPSLVHPFFVVVIEDLFLVVYGYKDWFYFEKIHRQ